MEIISNLIFGVLMAGRIYVWSIWLKLVFLPKLCGSSFVRQHISVIASEAKQSISRYRCLHRFWIASSLRSSQ
jgi:hypothetical protein